MVDTISSLKRLLWAEKNIFLPKKRIFSLFIRFDPVFNTYIRLFTDIRNLSTFWRSIFGLFRIFFAFLKTST
jgi:hypothetical protein